MPLSLVLTFHFNQHTNAYADLANRVCYRGLLNVLRAHPKLKFNLHLSGTLLRALAWYDPETLSLVRAGVAAGQFELLGSTYAQNVPYATDDWDNAQQIILHREILAKLFGVQPKSFWISERSWRQSLVKVIADGGFTHTLIEDQILQAGGLTRPVPVALAMGEQSITAVYDDNILRERLNYAVWFGRRKQLFDYLKTFSASAQRGSKDLALAYAEDAEAVGLWNWENGYLPQSAWANLDALLTEFEATRAFILKHLSTVPARQSLGPLPDGAALWMNDALKHPDAPYHEDGYEDWFDFLARSTKTGYFRKLYSVMRAYIHLNTDASERPTPAATAAEKFRWQAIEAFCHHQYEFGCIGVGGRGYWGWENVRGTYLFARLAQETANLAARFWIEDINGDGSDEQMLCDGRYLAILTAHGGRLLYWFDLLDARQLAGNHLAIPFAPFESGKTKHPHVRAFPNRWVPDTFEADLRPWRTLKKKERVPTRLGHRLPQWIFKGEPKELTVYRPRQRKLGEVVLPQMQIGLFNDRLTLDGHICAPDAFFDYRMADGAPCYLNHELPDLTIEKRLRQTATGLAAHYTFHNRAANERRLTLYSFHELNPDYREVLDTGRAALDFYMHDGLYPGVLNTVTRHAIALEPSQEWQKIDHTVGLLALEVGLTFELILPPQGEKTFEIKVNWCRAEG